MVLVPSAAVSSDPLCAWLWRTRVCGLDGERVVKTFVNIGFCSCCVFSQKFLLQYAFGYTKMDLMSTFTNLNGVNGVNKEEGWMQIELV